MSDREVIRLSANDDPTVPGKVFELMDRLTTAHNWTLHLAVRGGASPIYDVRCTTDTEYYDGTGNSYTAALTDLARQLPRDL